MRSLPKRNPSISAPPCFLDRREAVRLSACRGKLLEDAPPRVLGPLSNWTVPQRWFGHFYALGSACNAAVTYLLLGLPFYAGLAPHQQATAVLALALLQLHLGRRLAETEALMRYPPGSRMHGIAYLFGMRCGCPGSCASCTTGVRGRGALGLKWECALLKRCHSCLPAPPAAATMPSCLCPSCRRLPTQRCFSALPSCQPSWQAAGPRCPGWAGC